MTMDWRYKIICLLGVSVSVCECIAPPQPVLYGVVQLPQYPQPYSAGLDKQWDLEVPDGYRIQLTFNHLDIKPSADCYYDSLAVLFNEKVLGKFCGQENSVDGHHPGNKPILSPGNHICLVFQTNKSNPRPHQHMGFSAFYQAVDVDECSSPDPENGTGSLCPQICLNTLGSYLCSCHHGYMLQPDQRTCVFVQCESPKSISHGRVIPTYPQYVYRDYIQVRCDLGYKLMKEGKEIESYMSMCQQDGLWHTSLPECHIIDCGDPQPLLNGGVVFLSGSKNQHKSVIEYYCNEPYYSFPGTANVSHTCAADGKWRDCHNNDTVPPCLPVCGRPTVSLSSRGRVLGGKVAPSGAFPWQVMIRAPTRAGAVVIGNRWILTTAQTLVSESNMPVPIERVKLYVGDNNLRKLVKSPPLEVASLYVHPEYNPETNYNHDIALIKLNKTITFNGNVMPLCLPAEEDKYITDHVGWVSGFGFTEVAKISRVLRYIRLPLVDREKCRISIDRESEHSSGFSLLTDNMFCAGFPEGGVDSCTGDSGGAFALKDNGRFWAAGIVSWGIGCGRAGLYGVYTQVAQYLDWINKTMEGN